MRAFELSRDNKVIIVGGGLAGLTSAILLNRGGFEVTLVEKKHYPFHRVCGEYISNEVLPFFKSLGFCFDDFSPSSIRRLAVSSVGGKVFKAGLDLGGFGLSRFNLDNYLYERAKAEGVNFLTGLKVNEIVFKEGRFQVSTSDQRVLEASVVIASYGKRSNLDKNRSFFYHRSPYLGVKYHIKSDFPHDLVQLDNFQGGYCGTVKIEEDRFCLCYLSETKNLKLAGSIEAMEREFLCRNSFLKEIFLNSDFLYGKPEVINEISFEQKTLVENHVLFCGDSAGMISPLCGNGMSMAIHAAKILSDTISAYKVGSRTELERAYSARWKKEFGKRLFVGRLTQKLFGRKALSEFAINSFNSLPSLSEVIIKRSHGEVF